MVFFLYYHTIEKKESEYRHMKKPKLIALLFLILEAIIVIGVG